MKNSILATSLSLALTACSGTSSAKDIQAQGGPAAPEAARAAAAAGNALGFELYRQLRSQEGNLLLSPHSIAVALAMAQEGAIGPTRDEMLSVLHLEPDTAASPHRDLALLLEPRTVTVHDRRRRREMPSFELASANRLWVDERLDIQPAFEGRLARIFGASFARADFTRPEAVRRSINDWAAGATRDRIRDVVPAGQPSPEALLALANAIYFKARWAETFYEGATDPAPFHRPGAESVEVPMMRQEHRFAYAETDEAQWLELPYQGYDTSMVIVLPRDRDGLTALEESLDSDRAAAALDSLDSRLVSLRLPRFEFESSFSLAETLQTLGMQQVFSPEQADLSGISGSQRLWLDAVLHKAFIAVDEEGTEAAAVTVEMTVGAAIEPARPIDFIADHPFLFLIRHRNTGAILFLGRVSDPSL